MQLTDTQKRILEVGKREFLKKGFKDASMRAVVIEDGFTQDAHYDLIPEGKTAESQRLSTEYLRYFLEYIYENFDAFKLILCCSSGTKYESFVHDLVELELTQTEQYYRQLERQGKLEGSVSHELNHLVTSAYFTAVFEVVVHDMSRERAMSYVEELAVFFNCGWNGLLKIR